MWVLPPAEMFGIAPQGPLVSSLKHLKKEGTSKTPWCHTPPISYQFLPTPSLTQIHAVLFCVIKIPVDI